MTEPTVTLKPCPFCGSSNLEVCAAVHVAPCRIVCHIDGGDRTVEAIAAWNHRTASAPAGEVVAYKITDADGGYWFTDKPENPDLFDCEITQVPLYAHPPAPADLVEALRWIAGMTDIEADFDGFQAREKARAALAKHVKEPHP